MMRLHEVLKQEQGGYVLLLTLITSMSLFIALSGILSLSLINLASAKRTMFDTSALYVAEAGSDNATFRYNADDTYIGTNTVCPIGSTGSNPVILFNDSVKGKGTYETCLTNGTKAHEKIIYSVGKVYRKSTDTTAFSTRKIKVVLEGTATGAYAVQTGPGGLILSNSATITNGSVYVGGYLTLNNSSAIGTTTTPVGVKVANARCPSSHSAGYPSVCGSGVQPNPINVAGSQAHIYGSVCANGQTDGSKMTNTGLNLACGAVSPPSLPDYDRDAQKAAVATTITGAAASCSGTNIVTWPANVKITGDVTMSHNCVIKLSGNAWITGNFAMTQSPTIQPLDSVTTEPVVMVDGSTGVTLNNQAHVATNASGIGQEFITFWSAASCSPNCTVTGGTEVLGSDLYNSQTHTTISIGNQGAAAGTIFYARWSQVDVGQGGSLGAIVGQTISLANSGNLSFSETVPTGIYTYDARYWELQ